MGRAQERPKSASGSAWRLFPTLFTLRLVLGIAVGLVFNPEPSCQLPIQPGEGAIAADVGQSVGSPAVGNASGAGVAHGVFDMDAALLMVNFTRVTYCDEGEIQNWSVPGPHPMARPCLGHRPTALQPFWAWLQSLSRSSAAADAAASLLPRRCRRGPLTQRAAQDLSGVRELPRVPARVRLARALAARRVLRRV
jgi:hypothetical protein